MPSTEDRKAIHAYLDNDAWQAWQDFAEANGVSLTGLIEALGRELMDEEEDAEEHRIPWVKAGRRIDAQRRRRDGRRGGR
jgi:hypothetical protein